MTNKKKDLLDRRSFLKKNAAYISVVASSGAVSSLMTTCNVKSSGSMYDVVIKKGNVYDGTGSKPVITDIGIRDGKIIDIGNINKKAKRIINAQGLAVTPGFIDVHTHCDMTFKKTGIKRYAAYIMPSWKGNYNYMHQGVTTVVTGNCGLGYNDIDKWFGITESVKFGSNVYHLAPHGVIRENLFGKNQPNELSNSQLEAMKKRVAEEMEKGAVGLSTGLEYSPGLMASTKEIIELNKVVRKYNRIYATHIRNETCKLDINGIPSIETALKEAIEIGRRSEIPVEISHLKIFEPINNHKVSFLLEIIEKAREEGLDITADQYPYDAGSTFITFLLPSEFLIYDGIKEKYKTKAGKLELKKAIKQIYKYLGPDRILISMYPDQESNEGKTIQEISEITNRNPVDVYADMLCEKSMPMGVFFAQDMKIVRDIMKKDYIITGSDGWTVPKGMTKPHPRTYGTFPRKLRQFVLKERLIDLPLAIRSMTSLPAEKYNMQGRGKLIKGYYADIAIINMNNIADYSTYLDPHKYSKGIEYLLVNGTVSIDKGVTTGDRAGRTIRMS